jgi:hypothetical protein
VHLLYPQSRFYRVLNQPVSRRSECTSYTSHGDSIRCSISPLLSSECTCYPPNRGSIRCSNSGLPYVHFWCTPRSISSYLGLRLHLLTPQPRFHLMLHWLTSWRSVWQYWGSIEVPCSASSAPFWSSVCTSCTPNRGSVSCSMSHL